MMTSTALTFAFWIVMGVCAGYIAEKRGRNPWIWSIVGVFTSLLGVALIYWFLPVAQQEKKLGGAVSSAVEDTAQKVLDERWTQQSWHYLNDEHKEAGPIHFDELCQLWSEGKLQPSSFVWHEGLKEWMKITQLGGLEDCLRKN